MILALQYPHSPGGESCWQLPFGPGPSTDKQGHDPLLDPIVPNPYTLPSDIPSSTTHFTVTDLKDAFLTIPLHPDSLFPLCFHMDRPRNPIVLPANMDSPPPRAQETAPIFFGQALARDLATCPLA